MIFPDHTRWIGSPHPFDLHEAYLDFRSPRFRLEQTPARAELLITADSRYKLWINGRFVARGPARSYPQAQSVDRLDVSAYLQTDDNVLAVQVYQPGYSHFAYVHRGAAGLLAALVCDGDLCAGDGPENFGSPELQRPVPGALSSEKSAKIRPISQIRVLSLVTDARWRARRNPSFAENVPRVSIYGSGVELCDLNLADGWTEPGYDDRGWEATRIVAPVGGYPWTGLEERTLPLLVEREQETMLIERRRGPYPTGHEDDVHERLRAGWTAASPAPPSETDGWWTPRLAADQCAYWLLDLGRDYTCQAWFEVENARGEEQLVISYAEKLRDGELVLSDPATYCRVRLTDSFRLRPGDQTVEGFSLRGGRYLLIQLCGPVGEGLRLRARVRVAEYPLEIARPLRTDDPDLDAIVALCERTHHACLQDGFVDSVWRESSQWLGDALPQALIMASMNDDTRPLRRVIEMAVQGAYPDGVLPSVLPGEVHAYAIVDYNFMWVELLALYARLTDDQAFVRAMQPTLDKILARFHQDFNEDGLLLSQPGRRLFLDWAPISRSEPSAIYNLHYLLALQTAEELNNRTRIERIGRTKPDFLQKIREDPSDPPNPRSIQSVIRSVFWRDGRWWDDREGSTFSQLAASLALLTGCARPDETAPLLDAIIARSLDPDDDPALGKMVLASPFMHHYIFEALRRFGRDEAVVEIIKLRWGRWVRAGYPTTWENWNVDFPDGSQCHAFSAHPRYHLTEIGMERGLGG